MKTILVPVDFSDQALKALNTATALARKMKAEILVLNMLELNQAIISSSEGFHPEQTVALIKLAERRLEEFLAKADLTDVKVTPIIKHFKVFAEIDEVAKKHGGDLIIMGSHGADGLKELFIGSNAEKVVRHSEIPVLIVKEEMESIGTTNFLFACDFKEESLAAFQKALNFANALDAQLHLVFINTPGDHFVSTKNIYDRIAKFQHKSGVGKEVEIYNDRTVELGILNHAEQINADIIGIPTHGRTGLSHFFMGSIGEDLVNHSKIPVVTFKI